MNRRNVEYNPKMEVIVRLIHTLYELPDCCTGGCCHVVTDDYNVDDVLLINVIDACHRPNNSDAIDKELSSLICELLLQLSFEQRICLLYMLRYGYFNNNIICEEAWDEFFDKVLSCDRIIGMYKSTHQTIWE